MNRWFLYMRTNYSQGGKKIYFNEEKRNQKKKGIKMEKGEKLNFLYYLLV